MKLSKPITPERYEAVKQLYFDSWGRLRDDALESNPYLTAGDAFDVVASLAERLHLYPNHLKLNEDAFAQWAASVLTQTVFIHGLVRECEPKVREAIRVVLAGCNGLRVRYRDEHTLGTEDEIVNSTWAWALQNVDELRKVGTAKLTTRLAKRAKWEARAWKKTQVVAKRRFLPNEISDLVYCVNEVAANETGEPRRYALGQVSDWDHDTESQDAATLGIWLSPLEDASALVQ